MLRDIAPFYLSYEGSTQVLSGRTLSEADELRRETLHYAVKTEMEAGLQAAARRLLRRQAERQVSREFACALRRRLMIAPYRPPRLRRARYVSCSTG